MAPGAGAETASCAFGTRRQPERPTEGRGVGSPPPPPQALPPTAYGHLVFPRPRPPQVRERGESAKTPPPATGPAASRWGPGARGPASLCRARRGRSLVLTAGSREPSLPPWRAAGTGPRDSGSPGLPRPWPGLRGKAGVRRLVARVCSRYRSDLAGALSRTEPAARAGSETPQALLPVLGTPSSFGELGERQPRGWARCPWPRAGVRSARTRCLLPPALRGKLACPRCSPKGPLPPAWPSLPRGPPRLHAGARRRLRRRDRGTTSFREARGSGSVQLISVPRERPVLPAKELLGSSLFGARSGRELGPKRACAVGDLLPSLHQQKKPVSSLGGTQATQTALRFGRSSPRVGGGALREP